MLPNCNIQPKGTVSKAFLNIHIQDFLQACQYVKKLPYQRISKKENLLLVIKEMCGTCSSKHALLKQLAEENSQNINLHIAIYKMHPKNTPGLGNIIPAHVTFIPEAHAFLSYRGRIMDFTREDSTPLNTNDILEKHIMSSQQLIADKVSIHQNFMMRWCKKNNLNFKEIWQLREACIMNLSEHS